MNTHISLLPRRTPLSSSFSRALVFAVLIEGLVVAGIVFFGLYHKPPVTVGLRRKPMAVHLVTLPEPPPPKSIPKPVPVTPKPLQRPIPQVIHHRPVPLPVPPKRIPRKLISQTTPPPLKSIPPPPSPAVVAQAIDRYAVMLRTRIQDGLVVPRRIAALGISGRTVVAFKLTPAGQLLWVRIARSSGLALIDRASLAAVRGRSYPPFAGDMPHHAVIFHVSVGLNDHRNRF